MKSQSICILLCKLDGARFLEEQLRSISCDAFSSAEIIISDDGSVDDGLSIARSVLEERLFPFTIRQGPGQGFAANFRSLILAAEPTFDLYAFCDQDDVWHDSKLSAAAAEISQHPGHLPVLYGSRTRITDETNRPTGFSPLFTKKPSFQNALVQSIAGGNTMVMNRVAFLLLQKASQAGPFISHDWFAYQMVTGAGGIFIMDRTPRVDYRQHGKNVVGTNNGFGAVIARLVAGFSGRYTQWNAMNLTGLMANRELLTPEANATIDFFQVARSGGLIQRVVALRKSGVYRQTFKGNVSLWAACLLKRL